ncbi:hypothetical protein [Trichocoleus sp. FACHB-262]|uniref:COG1470 family protein n=1 Tax=Trichocoleus sp. FACHB-262 TaxID=2692869 RepID=UPI0016892E2A|nr:hypothetical protein [Trichocoleus sp. FACHB-262]MBD2120536.1 hypothetical protein [Trichocoleus sp. FACHB-262]
MNTQDLRRNSPVVHQPLVMMVAAWDRDQATPGVQHYLGVTLTNRGDQDAVVQVRLESPAEFFEQWCPQPEQWLALASGKSGELTFCITVPGDALPQWLNYEVVARPQGAYADYYLPPTRCRLQVLAPEIPDTQQDPTFAISPLTSSGRPLKVKPGVPVTVDMVVENRSERVDRFRLECTGLPEDWIVEIEYPQEYEGLGLVQIADSLGVNPGDRGTLRVVLQPPLLPLAGNYLPTFRLTSQNDPTLGLLGLLYLQVDPVYQLQAQLQSVQDQVHDRPAQFTLLLTNLGNTPRQLQPSIQALTPPEACTYHLLSDSLSLAPQTTTPVLLEGQPQRWWTRPWLGGGKTYPFQVQLSDPEKHPITPDVLQGHLTWMPRPWWQLLLVALAGLGLLGTLIFLVWWFWLRPPRPPEVLEFAAEDNRYAEANSDVARLRWQINHPEHIQTLKITGYSPEGGILSGPLVYDFTKGQLPTALQSFCTRQETLLTCNQIRTDAYQPGKYVFELRLLTKRRRAKPIVLKTDLVEISAKPMPTVVALEPISLVYREAAPGTPSPAEQALPVADRAGVRLNWVVTAAKDLSALHLVGRDQTGKMIGDVWYEFSQPGALPPELQSFCRLGSTLICRGVPTGLNAVGEYRLELQALAVGQSESNATTEIKPRSTEVVKIQAQMPQILNFQINGREAPAKVLIPLAPGQLPPMIQISWRVQGGSKTQVELTPAPGSVPPVGELRLPLSPQGSTTLALQVKAPTGEVLTRSVTLEVLNLPAPSPVARPVASMAEIPRNPGNAGAPVNGSNNANGSGAPSNADAASGETANPTPVNAPSNASPPPSPSPATALEILTPAESDRLSPVEQPPQFNPG